MASLTSALNYARSSLTSVAGQTAVVSQNITNARNVDYTRKSTVVASQSSGAISISRYDRAVDSALLEKLLSSSSSSAACKTILDGIKKLSETVGDPDSQTSPAALLNAVQVSLQVYEQNPSNQNLGANAVEAARSLATSLNSANSAIETVRRQADGGIAESVNKINNLLNQFKIVNDAITRGDGTKLELVDNLDTRDSIIKQLSEEIGIKTVTRANNDVALYTEGGVSLFETSARTVSFKPTPGLTAGMSGAAVYVDGVDISSSSSPMPSQSGNIYGLVNVRDRIAVTYQNQVDEFARGLITAFSESDQSAIPSLPDATGVFSYSGSPAVPVVGTILPGLAGSIRINSAIDPYQGGNISKLRDGGINGAAYSYNTTASAGFSDRIGALVDKIDGSMQFNANAMLSTNTSLKSFGSTSSGWLYSLYKSATETSNLQSAAGQRVKDALQSSTGVSIDNEMAHMLELERSYQASAKLISTVDQMFQILLGVVK